ncbi:MFS transporter [Sciscionella marina]|uniref:MFS transporter n=1 Tax=Sciscionella marina TaxID=508770 RepID=UPI00035E952A|nr:MFS transporter [Sciscionella marina]
MTNNQQIEGTSSRARGSAEPHVHDQARAEHRIATGSSITDNPATRSPHRSGWANTVTFGAATGLHGWCAAIVAPLTDSIAQSLNVPTGSGATAWISAGFFLSAAATAPLAGKLADRFGATRLMRAGLVVITLATISAALSPNYTWLIASRIACGIGTATQYPAALAALRQTRNRASTTALTAIVLTSELCFTLAPAIGSLLTQTLSWRLALTTPVLLAVPALIGTRSRTATPEHDRANLLPVRLGLPSLALFSACIVVTIVVLQSIPRAETWIWATMLAGLVALTWYWEKRKANPSLIPVGTFHPGLRATFLRHTSYYISYYLIFYAAPQWTLDSGLPPTLTPILLMTTTASTLVTRTCIRHITITNAHRCLLIGGSAMGLAAIMAILLPLGPPLITLTVLLVLLGIPNGLIVGANQTHLYEQVPAHTIGTMAGIYRSTQFTAGAIATASLGTTSGNHVAVAGTALGLMALFTYTTAVADPR